MSGFPSIYTLRQFVRFLRKFNGKFGFNELEIEVIKEDNLYKVVNAFDVYTLTLMDEHGEEQAYIHKYALIFEPLTFLKSLTRPNHIKITIIPA